MPRVDFVFLLADALGVGVETFRKAVLQPRKEK